MGVLAIGATLTGCFDSPPLVAQTPDPGELPPYGAIGPEQAAAVLSLLGSEPDFVLIDIRTEPEVLEVHIPGAANVDYYAPSFEEIVAQLDPEQTYLIYCRTGNRTGRAYTMMVDHGLEKVYDLSGGITAWLDLGYPTCMGPLNAEHTCTGELPFAWAGADE